MKNDAGRQRLWILFTAILVLLTRLPFLFNGYGIEEDSWGLVVNARQMAASGSYIYSRLPGHPVQEILLALIPYGGAFLYNLNSALFSVMAFLFFIRILKHYGIRDYIAAAMALAMTPVFYISSTYTIDYCYAAALILAAYYYMLKEKAVWTGILLGLAIGCRLTSAAMFLPLVVLIPAMKGRPWKTFFLLCVSTAVTTAIVYTPVVWEYGFAVIDTYKLPYPPIPKVLYKGSIGIWGVTGCIALLSAAAFAIINRNRSNSNLNETATPGKLHYSSWTLAILIHVILYIRLPEKSAFMIPALGFIILWVAVLVKTRRAFLIFCILCIISPFIISINLSDSRRGSDYSKAAVLFRMAGQEIFLDPLNGPVFSDYSKRKNKELFTLACLNRFDQADSGSVMLTGWWYNELLVRAEDTKHPLKVKLREELSEDSLKYFSSAGIDIFYLPEIERINDRRYQGNFTQTYASPLYSAEDANAVSNP
jgi:hypothetical protein